MVKMENKSDERKPVDLDTILVDEIGQIGLYQFRIIALAAIAGMFVSMATSQYVFTAARITTRCLIPECESPDQVEFIPSWISNAVPSSGNAFDNCNRYMPSNTSLIANDICPSTLFDRETAVSCEQFVYENTDTIVYEFDMGCDEWSRSLVGSVRTLGMLFSHPVTGYVSDRWGRRTAMAMNGFNTALIGIVRYWAGTYIGFTISQFFEAVFGFGAFSCAYIMSMELVGPKYREGAAAVVSTSFSLGQMVLGILAWGVPNWKNLTLVIYIPQLLTISYLCIMPESARWYMSKGRFEESEKVLSDAARVNKKELSEKSLVALREAVQDMKNVTPKAEPWLILQVFRHNQILIRCIVSPIWWITTLCIFYGLSINAVNMSGNQYVNYLTVSAVDIPGFWLAVVLMSRAGRKPVLIGGFWICAACMVGYIFFASGYEGLSLALYLIGKCSISCVMTTMHVYTVELYPTKNRHSLFAFSSMMGRVGSIVAPLTPALAAEVWEGLPFAIFGSLALISGALIFVTPETLGAKFPDTMEEAADIGDTKRDKESVS